MTVLGLDPGASGAAVLLCPGTTPEIVRFSKLTDADIASRVSAMASVADVIALEKVGSMPGQGLSSTFKFGASWGFLRGVVLACVNRGQFVEPTPQTWQRDLRIAKVKGESKTDRKRKLRQRAQELFPSVRMTADQADALLLAQWALTIELPKLRGESV